MNAQQAEAAEICKGGHNILITGQAGTGKTFLITSIAQSLRNEGKNVQVTCTTGIACMAFPAEMKSTTIHHWSGLDDGRYDSDEIVDMIKKSPKLINTLNNIQRTDVLIIDEISMLSCKMFQKLEEICTSIRNVNRYFGGIQIILSGDFYQLPPVANSSYNDSGEFCFDSPIFKSAIKHKIVLNEIIRQHDLQFAGTIGTISRGVVDAEVLTMMKNVKKPLPASAALNSIKLFANNFRVVCFNRDKLLEATGDVVVYTAKDSGNKRLLSKVIAQTILWLKIGSPVILLRNLSMKLVNGLQGHVVRFQDDGPVVTFPKVSITTVVKEVEFSMYSPELRANLASRVQIPLKLAYALTIHKAQGMTLSSVEVDCRDIYLPGQLGVAVGRVRNIEGLRVTNFMPKYIVPQSANIVSFIQEPSVPCNTKCCTCERPILESTDHFTVDADFELYQKDTTVHEEFDEDFNKIMMNIDTEDPAKQDLPAAFSITDVLKTCRPSDDTLTPKQEGVCDIIDNLDHNLMNDIKVFCCKTFEAFTDIIKEMNMDDPVPVKPDTITKFYENCNKHQTSDQHKLDCQLWFKGRCELTESHWYITYHLTNSVRKFILAEKEKLFPVSDRAISQREITSSSKSRIRYVGGYCVSQLRNNQLSMLRKNMYSVLPEGQMKYSNAVEILNFIDNIQEEEEYLKANSIDKDSLVDIVRKQYINKGLTNISDGMYQFFIQLCEICLKLMVDKNLNENAENIFECCWKKINEFSSLKAPFVKMCMKTQTVHEDDTVVESDVNMLLCDMISVVEKLSLIEYMMSFIVKKFLFVYVSSI